MKKKDAGAEAFHEGYGARAEGVDESKNPYQTSDDRHLSWNDGWAAADRDESGEQE